MPAIPLYHLARKACIKNIKCKYDNDQLQQTTNIYIAITDVGDIPYELIRPVLIKLENPDQLVSSSVRFIDVRANELGRENSRKRLLSCVESTPKYGENSSSGTFPDGRRNHTNLRTPRTGTKSTTNSAPRTKRR